MNDRYSDFFIIFIVVMFFLFIFMAIALPVLAIVDVIHGA